MKSKAIVAAPTITLNAGEAWVVYQALLAAKDKAVLGLEGGSHYSRDLSAAKLDAIESALRKVATI